MSSEIDELTVNYEDGGELVSKELDKVILTRGDWSSRRRQRRRPDRHHRHHVDPGKHSTQVTNQTTQP